jgi:hypothetical protein
VAEVKCIGVEVGFKFLQQMEKERDNLKSVGGFSLSRGFIVSLYQRESSRRQKGGMGNGSGVIN